MRLRLCLLTLVTAATALSVAGRDANSAQPKLDAPPPLTPQPQPGPAVAPRDSKPGPTETLVQNIVVRLKAVVGQRRIWQARHPERAVRAAIGQDPELQLLCTEFARRTGTLEHAITGVLYSRWSSPDETGKVLREVAGIS